MTSGVYGVEITVDDAIGNTRAADFSVTVVAIPEGPDTNGFDPTVLVVAGGAIAVIVVIVLVVLLKKRM